MNKPNLRFLLVQDSPKNLNSSGFGRELFSPIKQLDNEKSNKHSDTAFGLLSSSLMTLIPAFTDDKKEENVNLKDSRFNRRKIMIDNREKEELMEKMRQTALNNKVFSLEKEILDEIKINDLKQRNLTNESKFKGLLNSLKNNNENLVIKREKLLKTQKLTIIRQETNNKSDNSGSSDEERKSIQYVVKRKDESAESIENTESYVSKVRELSESFREKEQHFDQEKTQEKRLDHLARVLELEINQLKRKNFTQNKLLERYSEKSSKLDQKFNTVRFTEKGVQKLGEIMGFYKDFNDNFFEKNLKKKKDCYNENKKKIRENLYKLASVKNDLDSKRKVLKSQKQMLDKLSACESGQLQVSEETLQICEEAISFKEIFRIISECQGQNEDKHIFNYLKNLSRSETDEMMGHNLSREEIHHKINEFWTENCDILERAGDALIDVHKKMSVFNDSLVKKLVDLSEQVTRASENLKNLENNSGEFMKSTYFTNNPGGVEASVNLLDIALDSGKIESDITQRNAENAENLLIMIFFSFNELCFRLSLILQRLIKISSRGRKLDADEKTQGGILEKIIKHTKGFKKLFSLENERRSPVNSSRANEPLLQESKGKEIAEFYQLDFPYQKDDAVAWSRLVTGDFFVANFLGFKEFIQGYMEAQVMGLVREKQSKEYFSRLVDRFYYLKEEALLRFRAVFFKIVDEFFSSLKHFNWKRIKLKEHANLNRLNFDEDPFVPRVDLDPELKKNREWRLRLVSRKCKEIDQYTDFSSRAHDWNPKFSAKRLKNVIKDVISNNKNPTPDLINLEETFPDENKEFFEHLADEIKSKNKESLHESLSVNSRLGEKANEPHYQSTSLFDSMNKTLWSEFYSFDKRAENMIRLIDKSSSKKGNYKTKIIDLFSKRLFELPPRFPDALKNPELVENIMEKFGLNKLNSESSIIIDKHSAESIPEIKNVARPSHFSSQTRESINLPRVGPFSRAISTRQSRIENKEIKSQLSDRQSRTQRFITQKRSHKTNNPINQQEAFTQIKQSDTKTALKSSEDKKIINNYKNSKPIQSPVTAESGKYFLPSGYINSERVFSDPRKLNVTDGLLINLSDLSSELGLSSFLSKSNKTANTYRSILI